MATSIDSTAKCEFQSIIRFLQAEKNSAAEIHRRMLQVYGENYVSDEVVHEWCQHFKEAELMSMMKVDKEESLSQQKTLCDELIVRENSRFKITGISVKIIKVSRSSLYSIFTEHL